MVESPRRHKPNVLEHTGVLTRVPPTCSATARPALSRSVHLRTRLPSIQRDLEVIRRLLHDVTPDIVILTGDIIDGRPFKGRDRQSFLPVLREITDAVHESGALWSFVPGNHDYDEAPWTREDLLQLYALPGCLSRDAKTFNHTVTVGFEKVPTSCNSCLRLFLFDTGGNHPDPKLRYDTVGQATVDAFAYASKAGDLNVQGGAPLATAWYHIPLPECNGLTPVAGHNHLFKAALRAKMVPFPFRHQPFRFLVELLGRDRIVGSSKLNVGLFTAMAAHPNLRATFFGHDHCSDAVFLRDGVYMCYGRVGAHTPPSDWEGRAGHLPFDRHSARVCEFVVGTDAVPPKLLTYVFEPANPRSQLLLMDEKTTQKQQHRLDSAEHARRCALGFFTATALVLVGTVAFAIWAFWVFLAGHSPPHYIHSSL